MSQIDRHVNAVEVKPTVSSTDAAKIARASFVGTALEWYDYFLFGTASALVFNHLFFTDLNASAAILASFATFGVGFAARPIGAMFFGYIGDKIGRRPALLSTIVLIGVATALIGMLPTYAAIGMAAPIMLVILRLIQGLAVGGEWGGAVTMAIEHSPPERRARYAAMVQLGSPVGTLMSSGAFALVLLLPQDSFEAWGWRLPFLAAIPLLTVALYIRVRVEESPVFQQLVALDQTARVPAFDVFRFASGRLVVAIMTAMLGVGGYYMVTTFAISYGTNTLGVDRQVMVNATLVAAVVQIFATVVIGRLAERIGTGRITMWSGVATAIIAIPIFALIDTKSPLLITIAITVGILAIVLSYAVSGALLSELFPANLRYSGVSLGYNIAGAISGFVPLIASAMLGVANNASWAAAALLIIISVITAVGGFFGERMRLTDDKTLTTQTSN